MTSAANWRNGISDTWSFGNSQGLTSRFSHIFDLGGLDFFTSKHDEGDNKFYVINLKTPGTFLENQEVEAINLTLEMPNSIKKKTEGLTVFNEMIDLANSIKSNFDMGLFDENLNKVDAQTLEYLREEVSQTDMGYGT